MILQWVFKCLKQLWQRVHEQEEETYLDPAAMLALMAATVAAAVGLDSTTAGKPMYHCNKR